MDDALPPDRAGAGIVAVLQVWADAVGPEIARHARPARRTREGDLVVHCSDAGWAQTLTMMAGDLAARLAEALPGEAPRTLRFRVGTVADRAAAPEPLRPPTPAAARRAAELASRIADDRLRAVAERVIAHRLEPPDSA
jgi:predicted nucleic acid-binding Zn ribbon protein